MAKLFNPRLFEFVLRFRWGAFTVVILPTPHSPLPTTYQLSTPYEILNTIYELRYDRNMSKVKSVIKKVIPKGSIKQIEDTYRHSRARAAYSLYGKAPNGLKVIAVTGTNGKTTTCAFVNAVLKAAGLKTAVYTTAFVEINGKYEENHTHMTVASPWHMQKFFKRAKAAGVEWVVLEVTSHALDQYRIYGVPIEVAIVTNLTQDHLDYHGTMENYAAAKARLITDFAPKHVILNADDEWLEFFGRKVKKKLHTVGKNTATNQIKEVKLGASGTTFTLIGPYGTTQVTSQLVGDFNVYNAAMAITAGQVIGLNNKDIVAGIAALSVVDGRLEPVNAGQSFAVLVDFAHTPDALMNVLKAVKQITKGKVRVVFGADGDRDKKKREPMGAIAVNYADYAYLTDGETYTEDPDAIRRAVWQGVANAKGTDRCVEIGDRKEAIRQAIADADPGDAIVLTGVGNLGRNVGGKVIDWNEREIARTLLEQQLRRS